MKATIRSRTLLSSEAGGGLAAVSAITHADVTLEDITDQLLLDDEDVSGMFRLDDDLLDAAGADGTLVDIEVNDDDEGGGLLLGKDGKQRSPENRIFEIKTPLLARAGGLVGEEKKGSERKAIDLPDDRHHEGTTGRLSLLSSLPLHTDVAAAASQTWATS